MEIEVYKTASGKQPFNNWLNKTKDIYTKAKILSRLDRLKLGNFGDCKALDGGIYELRIHYGSGMRVYYAKKGAKIILLLCGGNKGSQKRDIKRAKLYLEDYKTKERR